MRSARWAIRAIPVVTVLVGVSGCGFLGALAHPEAPVAEPIATATPAPASPSEPPPALVDGELRTTGGAPAGRLVVSLGEKRTGLQPPVSNSQDCHFDPNALQYLPIEFASDVPGLAAHLEVSAGPDTPTDVGDVGLFVESNDGDQVYCTHSPPWPTRDSFFNQAGARVITAWVVLQHAVTPAIPDGRPEVFPTLRLRISDLRQLDDPTTLRRRLVPGTLTTGAACTDDAGETCVPLG